MGRKLICDGCGGSFPHSQVKEFLSEDDDFELLCKKCMTDVDALEHFQDEFLEELEDKCQVCHIFIQDRCEYSLRKHSPMVNCIAFEFCKEMAIEVFFGDNGGEKCTMPL